MWTRIARSLGLAIWLAALPALVGAQEATPTGERLPVDLTAMVLFPTDIPGQDLALGFGAFTDPAELAPDDAERQYQLTLFEAWPTELATPVGLTVAAARTVTTGVTEFPSAQDAATALASLEQDTESAELPPGVTSQEEQPLDAVIGDEAALTAATGLTPAGGDPFTSLSVNFREDNLLGTVVMEEFAGRAIETTEIAGLAQQLVDRIEAVRQGERPDLGQRVLRFAGPAGLDHYTRIDGILLPRREATAAVLAEEQARSTVQAIYTRDQEIAGAIQPTYLSLQVGIFASPEEATTYQLDGVRQRVARDPLYETVEPVADAPTMGDASEVFAYTYADDTDFADWTGYGIVARSGPSLLVMFVEQQGEITLETAVDLAQAQLTCLTGDPCPDDQPLPASLREPLGAPSASPTPG